jgi:hypothetical protein
MSRYVNTRELIRSLFDFADGKKSVGQCIDDTPTADVIEREKLEAAFEKIKLKAWKDGTITLGELSEIFREVV